MKLGIINGWDEGNFRYVRDKGLEAVEFCVNYNYDSEEFLAKAETIKSYSEKYNVESTKTAKSSPKHFRLTRISSLQRQLSAVPFSTAV